MAAGASDLDQHLPRLRISDFRLVGPGAPYFLKPVELSVLENLLAARHVRQLADDRR
jgi:hypothetical protein